jgi:hypothetical protein
VNFPSGAADSTGGAKLTTGTSPDAWLLPEIIQSRWGGNKAKVEVPAGAGITKTHSRPIQHSWDKA